MTICMSERNAKRLEIMFPADQHEFLVNECFEDAFQAFLIFLECVDKEKLNAYFEAMEEESHENKP